MMAHHCLVKAAEKPGVLLLNSGNWPLKSVGCKWNAAMDVRCCYALVLHKLVAVNPVVLQNVQKTGNWL